MSLRDFIFGRPLASSEEAEQELTVVTGIPALGLDALASTGYGPEAALTILLPLSVLGLRYFPYIIIAVIIQLTMLYLSYRQTAAAYPNGGGAYIVAKDNLGSKPAVWAAVALLIDYLLNVSVAIAAGVGTVASAAPLLHPYKLAICLVIVLSLMIINLRGIKESGVTFVLPVFVFIGSIAAAIVIGLVKTIGSGGHPQAVVTPPALPHATATLSTWLLLGAFANGCTAMTGVEAVSNGVPLFREPKVRYAQWTLTVIVGVLALFLLGLAYLCPAYHIGAMNEQQAGYQTILSQLLSAVAGRGIFYYIATASLFIVLTYSAQTSFTGFPRVCRLLAEDKYMPSAFADRGRRLVYSYGIVVLTVISGCILAAFGGITEKLIPLFAVGAFGAFLFSQLGMVVHWRRKSGPGVKVKMTLNALGATTTSIALLIIIITKFAEGAWLTVIVIPSFVFLLLRINQHYRQISEEVETPVQLDSTGTRSMIAIVPVASFNRVAEKAIQFASLISDNIIVVHVASENEDDDRLRQSWEEKIVKPAQDSGIPICRLEIIYSPYRRLYEPILNFVDKIKDENPGSIIAVVMPELVEPHWYEYVLHNLHGAGLRSRLYQKRDERIVVINAPWFLRAR